jgi:acyl carrier protein phosphodiesterase
MNFLAHFHLAWPDPGLVAGGLEGDYRKGLLRGELPRNIESGVRLHRAIDAYTDAHPVIAQLKRQFPAGLRRYAGILIDLSFDHFLSVHWARFSDITLEEFSHKVYSTLSDNGPHLSDGSRRMLGRLIEHDILGLYGDWDTIPASAERIGRRFRRENPFLDIGAALAGERGRLEHAFLSFYPDLQVYSNELQIELTGSSEQHANMARMNQPEVRNQTSAC